MSLNAIFGHFTTHSLSQSLELLPPFPLRFFHRFECLCTNGRPPHPASEPLQKGEGGWAAFLQLALIVLYFPFRQTTPSTVKEQQNRLTEVMRSWKEHGKPHSWAA